jgi:VanZ family protein
MRLRHWLPPVVWMIVILSLASDTGSAERTGRLILPLLRFLVPGASPEQLDTLHAIVRKLGHLTEYGVLAALWLRAFVIGRGSEPRVAAASAWIIALVWAIVDESYQSTVASRSGSALDVVIDAVGAFAVALPAACGWCRRPTP